MNPQTFFEHFERLTNAPNAVARLRELILQLAVQGKLVEQNERDEPATRLLERIEAERKRLIKEKKLREAKVLPSVSDEEAPYALPHGWLWTRLGSIGLINPRNDFDDVKQASFVPMSLVPQAYGDPLRTETRAWGEIKKGFTHFAEGDVVLAKITPCFQNGKAAVMRGLKNSVGAGTTELLVFRPLAESTLPEYALLYLKSPEYKLAGEPRMTGTAGQKRVPNHFFAEHPFPLPPLEEQKRIVVKVDELMQLCGELERAQAERCEARQFLNRAAIDQLLAARDAAELQERWQMISKCFPTLTAMPNQIDKLRQTVLQLAVQGRLTRQNPQDGPASDLLERISVTKELLVKEKKIKKPAIAPPIDKIPFILPNGWIWARLTDLCSQITDGVHSTPVYTTFGVPFLSVNNLKNNQISFDACKYISPDEHQLLIKRCKPEYGDILLGKVGSIGVCAIIETEAEFSIFVQLALIKPVKQFVDSQYIKLSLLSAPVKEQIFSGSAGSALQYIGIGKIQMLILPLPPLAEQKRIVAIVNRLMALCDELEAGLRRAEEDGERLLRAAVRSLLFPAPKNSMRVPALA